MLNFHSKTLKFSISGLRGIFPDDISAQNLPNLIYAFHKVLPPGDIALARDNRPTGKAFLAIAQGTLLSLGRNVHNLDLVPTPTIKAYVAMEKLAGGIMVSASHNPIVYNGLKFIAQNGFFFNQDENDHFRRELARSADGNWGEISHQGTLYEAHEKSVQMHVDSVLKSTGLSKNSFPQDFSVAIDPVGSCGIDPAKLLLDTLGIQTKAIHAEETSDFPRPPEPVAAALSDLSTLVTREKCNVGFAFDPDADRLSLVDESGTAMGEEYTLPLAGLAALKNRSGDTVVNLSTSQLNRAVASQFSSQLHLSRVGEANVVAEMIKQNAVFGGEGNGGVIDPEVPSFGRDAIAGVAWILKLLLERGESLSKIASSLPQLHMEKVTIALKNPLDIHALYNRAREFYPTYHADTQDGLHLSGENGLPWIHIRPSNTEPIVRLIVESESKEQTREIVQRFSHEE